LEAERTAGRGWRVYGENAVNRVLNVRALIGAGLTVDDIRHVASCLDMKTRDFMACQDSPDGVLEAYEGRLAAVEAEAAKLARYRAELVERIALLRAGRPDGDFGDVLREAESVSRT
jgi:DNA-binding transcriptional MerR regulator